MTNSMLINKEQACLWIINSMWNWGMCLTWGWVFGKNFNQWTEISILVCQDVIIVISLDKTMLNYNFWGYCHEIWKGIFFQCFGCDSIVFLSPLNLHLPKNRNSFQWEKNTPLPLCLSFCCFNWVILTLGKQTPKGYLSEDTSVMPGVCVCVHLCVSEYVSRLPMYIQECFSVSTGTPLSAFLFQFQSELNVATIPNLGSHYISSYFGMWGWR